MSSELFEGRRNFFFFFQFSSSPFPFSRPVPALTSATFSGRFRRPVAGQGQGRTLLLGRHHKLGHRVRGGEPAGRVHQDIQIRALDHANGHVVRANTTTYLFGRVFASRTSARVFRATVAHETKSQCTTLMYRIGAHVYVRSLDVIRYGRGVRIRFDVEDFDSMLRL